MTDYVMVPREPTDEMVEAAVAVYVAGKSGYPLTRPLNWMRGAIEAALAAAPQAEPVQEQEQEQAEHDPALSAALGWPGGISDPVLDRTALLQQVAALAQQAEPVQPVAGVVLNDEGRAALVEHGTEDWHCALRNARRLYTRQTRREPVPLTEEEIDRITDAEWATNNHKPIYAAHRAYARAVEAALAEQPQAKHVGAGSLGRMPVSFSVPGAAEPAKTPPLNALTAPPQVAAPQAEPVAWLSSDGVVAVTNVYAVAMRANGRANWLAGYVPLYAAPPQAAEPSEALREAARMALSLLDAADAESVTKREFEARALMARDALREALGDEK